MRWGWVESRVDKWWKRRWRLQSNTHVIAPFTYDVCSSSYHSSCAHLVNNGPTQHNYRQKALYWFGPSSSIDAKVNADRHKRESSNLDCHLQSYTFVGAHSSRWSCRDHRRSHTNHRPIYWPIHINEHSSIIACIKRRRSS